MTECNDVLEMAVDVIHIRKLLNHKHQVNMIKS